MNEEYLSWEDEIRLTFVELADILYKNSNPIDFLIEFAWANGADRFVVNNAKDELQKMRQKMTDLENNQSYHVACWARINSRGDLYDPRLILNPYLDESTVLPLYANEKEFKEKYGKLS